METNETVYKTLKDSATAMKAGEVAEQTGIDKKAVSKAIKELIAEDKVHSPKYCYYAAK